MSEFDDLSSRIGHPVGEAEIHARQLIGDARYDEIAAYQSKLADVQLDGEKARVSDLVATAAMKYALGSAAQVGAAGLVLIGIGVLGRSLRIGAGEAMAIITGRRTEA